MKKVLNLVLVAVLALTVALGMAGCDAPNNGGSKTGLLYKKVADDTCVIYGYKDAGEGVDTLEINDKLELPDGVSKVRIKSKAFYGNNTIKNLVISEVVTEIEAGAFDNMQALKSLTIPFVGRYANSDAYQNESASAIEKAVDAERTIAHFFGSEQYDKGVQITINYGASTVSCYVPATLKVITVSSNAAYSIPMFAFNGANTFSAINLVGNIDAIGVSAFANTVVANITIPASVKAIYKNAFNNAGVKVVSFEAGACDIVLEEGAFAGCKSLDKVCSTNAKTIDLSVFSSVGKNAFKVGNATKYTVVDNGFDLSDVIDSDNIA